MPPRGYYGRIADMIEAANRIQRYNEGIPFDEFVTDSVLVDASLRNITVIGEAANHVPVSIKSAYPDIEWLKIRGMRNAVIHNYFEIDLDVVWDTVEHDVPELQRQLQHILDNEPPDPV